MRGRVGVVVLVVWAVLACAGHKPDQTLTSGPFEADLFLHEETSGGPLDPHGRPRVRYHRAEYHVRHRGQPVPSDDEEGRFTEVVWLPKAPHPTMLASYWNTRLLVDRDGVLDVLPLDVRGWQQLDGPGGQPDDPEPAFVDGRDQRQFLPECELLLIGRRFVLEVPTLALHELPGDPAPGLLVQDGARALSPDKKSIVFAAVGEVLVVYDYARDVSYAVPFSASLPGYQRRDDVTPRWIERHFAWDAAGKLVLRSEASPR